MSFAWLKHLMPRGLYGRAALILVVPIIAIQLVVSVAFIQRHFEEVTRQMTRNILIDLTYLEERVNAAGDATEAVAAAARIGPPLALSVILPAAPRSGDQRAFYDLSGRVVIGTLREGLPAITDIDLSNPRRVDLTMGTRFGPMQVDFERRRVSASNPHQLLVLMLATSLLMTLVAYLFLRNQLRPIRRLARAAEAFGRGQSIDYRPAGATEVRAAGNAFLAMRARIERHIEQRTQMLSGVSHDLRTPLTRLKLGLSMLPEDDETRAMARDIREMQGMLETFLDFARGDATEDETEEVDPLVLAETCVSDFRRMGREVTLVATAACGMVRMRPQSVRRAIDNLLSNALRYGHQARLSVALLDRSVRFTVEDDGPGIPKNRRGEAMRPFTRLDGARNQDRGSGAGLGLAIAADIARGHGGSLRLSESEDLGGLKAELVLAR